MSDKDVPSILFGHLVAVATRGFIYLYKRRRDTRVKYEFKINSPIIITKTKGIDYIMSRSLIFVYAHVNILASSL